VRAEALASLVSTARSYWIRAAERYPLGVSVPSTLLCHVLAEDKVMSDPLVCTKCGSESVIPRLRMIERGEDGARHDVQLEMQRRPNALLFKRPERSNLLARACGDCGHVELYADAPRALYMAWLEADAHPTVSAVEELEQTREALADSQIRLQELEDKLALVEELLEQRQSAQALPKGP